jgi:hypothetical protein
MTKTSVIRSLAVTTALAACALGARAEAPDESESWWRLDNGSLTVNGTTYPMTTTVGLSVDGDRFCGVSAFKGMDENVWIIRGRVLDGRLVEDSRTPVRGPVLQAQPAPPLPAALRERMPHRLDPTDFFVQTTAVVSRDRSSEHPRGVFAIYQPLHGAPNDALWLDMAWHCSAPEAVEKVAEAR